MKCSSCGIDISSDFKHAIEKNECPSCGGNIMDEEFLVLLDSVKETILLNATVREETAKKLAVVLVSEYNMDVSRTKKAIIEKPKAKAEVVTPNAKKSKVKPKNAEILEIPDVPKEISDEERERIMEEAVRAKYNLSDSSNISSYIGDDEETEDFYDPNIQLGGGEDDLSNSNFLEQDRLRRLASQQQALKSGKGSFRRSGS